MTLILPELPYSKDALAPVMSAETLEFHHEKHHNAYVVNGNKLIQGSEFEGKSIEEIIKTAPAGGLFNNAAQVWNHTFFWESMKANGGGDKLPSIVQSAIDADLGGFEKFKEDFANACMTQFGSGWAWLVFNPANGKLEIAKTPNADNPLTDGKAPILTCDVWEHAYYIDYRNARPKYVGAFLDKLINWERVEARLQAAK